METIRYILELYCDNIARILFTGFALYFLISQSVKPLLKSYRRFSIYNNYANRIILYSGIVYVVLFVILSIIRINIEGQVGELYRGRMFGTYYFGYWTFPVIKSVITFLCLKELKYKPIILWMLCLISIIPIEIVTTILIWYGDNDFIQVERIYNTLNTYGICISLFVLMLEIGYQGHFYKAKKKESTES